MVDNLLYVVWAKISGFRVNYERIVAYTYKGYGSTVEAHLTPSYQTDREINHADSEMPIGQTRDQSA